MLKKRLSFLFALLLTASVIVLGLRYAQSVECIDNDCVMCAALNHAHYATWGLAGVYPPMSSMFWEVGESVLPLPEACRNYHLAPAFMIRPPPAARPGNGRSEYFSLL